jgi:pilus assembly protein CpaB
MLILLGILLLVGVLAVLVILPQTLAPAPTPVPPTPVPEIPTREILVAAQNVPRGSIIREDAVAPATWPEDSLAPLGDLVISEPEEIIGKIARTDIMYMQPLLTSLIAADPKDLAARGSDASLFIPPGRVAVSFPINQLSSVGYAIGAGDHVDVIVAFSIMDVNQEGQYPIVPFNRDLIDELIAAGLEPQDAIARTIGDLSGVSIKPRLLSQLTLQNIEVLHVGTWPVGGILPKPTPTPLPNAEGQQQPANVGGTPTVTPPRPDMIILLVDQQQALILQWLQTEGNISINLALRGAGDNAPVSTETVSYQYILTNFNISIPPKTNTIIAPATPTPQP